MDKALCGTTEHVVVEADLRNRRTGPVSLARVLREAGLAIVCVAGLAAVLFVFVGTAPGIGVLAFALVGVLLTWIVLVITGHRPGCAAKKALVLFFGWMEFAF
ncbi:hypothetical protein ACFVVU_16890 [Kitasatospora sp. NPDC057965]|uniref:hypothetical protein n=1 Tax=Kitasatospora sp. NPDC057965 TaxID=3346291 RepID=UPI0036DA815E